VLWTFPGWSDGNTLLITLSQTIIANAAVYALLATTWLLILRVSGVVHFAHGTTYMLGGYIGVALVPRFGFPVALIGAVIGGGLFGLACEWIVYAPLVKRRAASWTIVISSLAIFILGENVLGMIFGSQGKTVHTWLTGPLAFTPFGLLLGLRSIQLVYIITLGLWFGVLAYVLVRTNLGLYFRAIASNPVLAQLSGVPTLRVRRAVFFAASAVAAIAGLLWLIDVGTDLTMDFTGIFYGFVPAIVAGARSLRATAITAMLIALASHVIGVVWGEEWVLITVFLALAAVIVARPIFSREGRQAYGF
jgi:branched-chain amino acid transport system permease protein